MNIKVTKKLVLQNFPMLDDHNAESVVAALTSDVKFNGRLGGQTFKPTGTGKTLIQAAIIALDIMLNPKKNGIYILHVPRIILSYQQLKALYKFNQKYKTLNEAQKNLLKNYINNVSNTNSMRDFVDEEAEKLETELKVNLPKVTDQITKIKLTEAINQINNLTRGKLVNEKQVLTLMRYYELVKELKNVHKS